MLAATGLALLSACSSAPEITVNEEATLEATAELENSREAGDLAANDRAAYDVPIRFNPSRCPCPDFEVWVYGAWQRVWLEGSPEAVKTAETIARTGGGESTIRGTLTAAERPSARNVNYPVFELL